MGFHISFHYIMATFSMVLVISYQSPLIWISLDALGKSMITEHNTPFLYNLSLRAAVSLEHHPSYITKTFPNHFSAATGLNVEEHQIVGNYMIDDKLGVFNKSNNNPAWWNPNNDSYPIWTLNEMHNKLGSATIYWPGSSAPFGINNTILPKYHTPVYDTKCDCRCRLENAYDNVISGAYELVMVYIDDIDVAGHFYGIKSSNFSQTIKKVDKLVELFFINITHNNSLADWNLIISSDHGMIDLNKSKTIFLKKILPSAVNYTLIVKGSQSQLNLHNKSDENTVIQLISKQRGVYMVATPKTMPEQYKYSKSKRIPDITIIMKEGWAVVQDEESYMVVGDHGYPASIAPSMYAIMMGHGKDFHKNITINKTKMTDLFGISCYILEIENYCKIDDHAKLVARTLLSIKRKEYENIISTISTIPSLNGEKKQNWILISAIVIMTGGSFIGCGYVFWWWRKTIRKNVV